MLNSKKNNFSQSLDNITLPMINDTYNGVPKMTSTPLNPRNVPLSKRSNVLLSSTKSKLLSPRRYSLSDINSPTNKSNFKKQEMHSPGPLLASLNFKDNVSMYEETKSSGLARRIVLYNEEAEQEKRPTHQEKYHSPGLFPIVHLFKNKPPFLGQSPRRVKIKLSSPDYLKNHSPEHRSILLEGLARPRLQNQRNLSSSSQSSNETGTKSVLDALKEISRKRIHSSEECDLNEESGKRIRTELQNGVATSSKRNRADSPLLDSSDSPPPKQTQKKFCVYDEFAASKSSSDFSFLNKMEPARSKRKTISTSTESLKEIKQVKLINAETQTMISSSDSKTKSTESNTDKMDSEKSKKRTSPIKVFDDAPLDRIRKNRLAALMGNLAGKEAILLPKPLKVDKLSSETTESKEEISKPAEAPKESEIVFAPPSTAEQKEKDESDSANNKPLISILSPPKTTKELEKHVHFNLPGITSSSTSITQTSASIVTPIVSASISNSSISSNTEKKLDHVGSKDVNPKLLAVPSLIPSFSFEKLNDAQINSAVSTNNSIVPSFNFSRPKETSQPNATNIPKLTFEPPKTSSSQKLGGFKFDLKAPSNSTLATPSFSKPETSAVTFTNPSIVKSASSTTTSVSSSNDVSFTFRKPTEPKKDSTFTFGPANSSNSNVKSVPTFNFGGGLSKSQTLASITTEPKAPSLNTTTTTSFSFGSGTTSTFGTTTAGSSTFTSPPTFGFTQSSITTTTSSMFSFGHNTATNSAAALVSKPTFSFGTNTTPTTSSSMFGSSITSGFGSNPTTTTSGFNNAPTTTTSDFGSIPTTSTIGFGTTPVSSFGNTQVTSTPIFGNTSNTSVFGTAPVTATTTFGSTSTSTPGFGSASVTSSSVFGSSNTSTTTGFGNVAPTTPSVFRGGNQSFGTNPTATPIFGSSNTKTPAFGPSNVFGAANTQTPTFGSNTAPSFRNISEPKPMFGASSNTTPIPAFGSNTFGSTSATSTTTSAPIFGTSNSTPTFSFGTNKPITNVFGSVTTTSSTTFTNNTFGSNTSTSGFNQSSGFGNNTSAFGSSTTPAHTFGATSTPAFGQVENKPFVFGGSGENKTAPSFGSGNNSAFVKPINNQSGFGGSTGGFGSANTSGFGSQQTNGGFNFASNATSPSAAFTFGANSGGTETPKPTFNFTAGSTNPPPFGTNNSTNAFGAIATPSFGTPTFGPTAPSAGVFNIGAGSSSSRPRTQLRAKRRT